MPPKKKAKASIQASSPPAADEESVAAPSPVKPAEERQKPQYDILKDPWTDEQETSLFKGIIKWKPAGMHKHFRMIALSEHLRNHGYDPTIEKHTRIPGIWEKLGTIYNLPIIDDRENFWGEKEEEIPFLDFQLPDEDYGQDTFMRGKRNSREPSSSPPRLDGSPSPAPQGGRKRKRAETITTRNRASTVEDTDDTRTSPANSPPPKATRAGRSTNRLKGRAKAESGSRHQSKDTTVTEDEGQEETEEAAEDDEDDAEDDGTPSPKASKATSKGKADAPTTRKSKRKR